MMLAQSGWAKTTVYALAIGNNEAPNADSRTLKYADDDAARSFEFFSRFAPVARVLTVLDAESQRRHAQVAAVARPPSAIELRLIVDEFAAAIRADVTRGDSPVVYISFSGHGAQATDGTFFLALQGENLTRRALHEELLPKLAPAFVHLFVDACHAERVVGDRGSGSRDLEVARVAVTDADRLAFEPHLPARFSRVGAIMATTADEQAHEWSRIESGVFTHELLSGLSGAADVNSDGRIEYSELQAFIASANRDIIDPRAAPKVVALAPQINVHVPVITVDQFRGTAQLTGRFDFGHFYVELANGQRELDAHLVPDQVSTIAVPAGRLFVISGDTEAELELQPGQTVSASSLRWAPATQTNSRGSISTALGRSLFNSAFGEVYYKGFVDSLGEPSVIFRAAAVGAARVEMAPPPARLSARKSFAVAAFALAGALTASTVVTSVAAANARRDFDQTQIQKTAYDAQQRVNSFTAVSVLTACSAAASAVGGVWLWRTGSTVQASVLAGPGGAGLTVRGQW